MLGSKSSSQIRLNCIFMMLFGIWPLGNKVSTPLKILRALVIAVVLCLMFFQQAMCCLYFLYEEEDKMTKLKVLGPIIFGNESILKILWLASNIDEIRGCLEHVEEDWQAYTTDPSTAMELKVMQEKAKFGRVIAFVCAAFMYAAGISYHFVMPLTGNGIYTVYIRPSMNLDSINYTDASSPAYEIRTLSHPMYRKFLDIDQVSTFKLVFLIYICGGFFIYTSTIAICALKAGFVTHICGQLEIVTLMLHQFIENKVAFARNLDDDKTITNARFKSIKMSRIIEHHLRTLSFADRVRKDFNFVCFVQFMSCTIVICLLEYYVVAGMEHQTSFITFTYFMLILSIIFNIFIICYIGEILKEQSEKISSFIYMFKWNMLPSESAKELILVILFANSRPAKMTAGFVVELSIRTFTGVLQKSASCFQLLRTLML